MSRWVTTAFSAWVRSVTGKGASPPRGTPPSDLAADDDPTEPLEHVDDDARGLRS